MILSQLIENYRNTGYNYADATAQVCQDVILYKIANSRFGRNITIKGGVVMHSISNDKRRATQDLDLDFIKYSLADEYIYKFIETLSNVNDNIKIEIISKIEELHQHDYNGKRVYLKLTDSQNYSIETKLDIGVEKNFDEEQEDYYFNLESMDKQVNLKINSCEQIFTEKLKSLLKLGLRSSRYKDLFDFYYLISENKLDKNQLYIKISTLIYNDHEMYENNIDDILKRLKTIFYSQRYKRNLTNPKVNWLDVDINEAIDTVFSFIESLIGVMV